MHKNQDQLNSFKKFISDSKVDEPLSNHIVSGVIQTGEALLCPPTWMYTEVLGQEHVLGLKMNYIHSFSVPDLKCAFLFDSICKRQEQSLGPIVQELFNSSIVQFVIRS